MTKGKHGNKGTGVTNLAEVAKNRLLALPENQRTALWQVHEALKPTDNRPNFGIDEMDIVRTAHAISDTAFYKGVKLMRQAGWMAYGSKNDNDASYNRNVWQKMLSASDFGLADNAMTADVVTLHAQTPDNAVQVAA